MAETDRLEHRESTQDMPKTAMPDYPGTPRWVKIMGIIALVVVLLLGILLLSGGHGPWRHMQLGGDVTGQTPPSNVMEHMGQ